MKKPQNNMMYVASNVICIDKLYINDFSEHNCGIVNGGCEQVCLTINGSVSCACENGYIPNGVSCNGKLASINIVHSC